MTVSADMMAWGLAAISDNGVSLARETTPTAIRPIFLQMPIHADIRSDASRPGFSITASGKDDGAFASAPLSQRRRLLLRTVWFLAARSGLAHTSGTPRQGVGLEGRSYRKVASYRACSRQKLRNRSAPYCPGSNEGATVARDAASPPQPPGSLTAASLAADRLPPPSAADPRADCSAAGRPLGPRAAAPGNAVSSSAGQQCA